MWYNYIYLNPNVSVRYNLKNFNTILEYEPFYIGKGKNDRYLHHFQNLESRTGNMLKKSIINKILKGGISKQEYIDKYIIRFNFTDNEQDVLIAEKYLIEWIGTRVDIFGVLIRGPLTNLLRGGFANPVMWGPDNPFSGKHHTKSVIELLRISGKKNTIRYWNDMSENDRIRHVANAKHGIRLYFDNIYGDQEKTKKSIKMKDYWLNLKENNPCEYNRRVKFTAERVREYKSTHPVSDDTRHKMSVSMIELWKDKKENDPEWYQSVCDKRRDFWKDKKENDPEWYRSVGNKRRDFWNDKKENELEWYQNKINNQTEFWNNKKEQDHEWWQNQKRRKIENNEFNVARNKLNDIEFKKFCTDRRGGKNNNMYGQGHKLRGNKNGRSKIFYIKDYKSREWFVNGNFKSFKVFIKSEFIQENPGRKNMKPSPFIDIRDYVYLESINWIIKEIQKSDMEKYKNGKIYED